MTEGKLVPIPKGSLFTITTGEYSDYSIMGVFKATEELDTETLQNEWLAGHPDQRGGYSFNCTGFLADLVRRNLIEMIDSWEWHLHDYSNSGEMQVFKLAKPL